MNTRCVSLRMLVFACIACAGLRADIRSYGPPLPQHPTVPTPWGDGKADGQNHQHNENVNIENVLDPTNYMYDAYGSWFNDGSGMKFHWTNNSPGTNDPNYIGHGYIPADTPVLYQYANAFLDFAPLNAQSYINNAFNEWETQINGALGYRNPADTIGFSWGRAPLLSPAQINITWQPESPPKDGDTFTDANGNGKWDPGEPFVDGSDANGAFDTASDISPAWVTPAAYPSLTFVGGYYTAGVWHDFFHIGDDTPASATYDLFTVALHETGHLVGLDDLYGLYSGTAKTFHGFPDSIMGTAYPLGLDESGTPIDPAHNARRVYRRSIDVGSIQGGIDLYSIPVPEPASIVFLATSILFAGAMCLRQCRRRASGRRVF